MATFQVVDEFINYMGDKIVDMNSDTFKAALSNVAPTKAGTTTLSTVTQIGATGGYAVAAVGSPTWSETAGGSGIWEWDCAPFAWTASGADFDTARYIVIYDDTPGAPADPVVGYLDYGGSFVVTNGNTLTVTPGANGVFRITVS